jgi:signal transduction histidine kinase
MKLLNRSIRPYLVYSFIIVVVTVVLFYFLIQAIVQEEVDESLIAQKEEVMQSLSGLTSPLQHAVPGIQLFPSQGKLLKDSLYNIVVFDNISKEQIPYRVIASEVTIANKPYTMILKKSLIDNQDLIESILLVMITLLVLILAGFLVINRIISKKIWKPFYYTVNRLNTYDFQSDNKIEFEKTNIDEFRDLNNSISELIKRNLFVFQSQKEFTENAAHEMQTPLAILQGKIELLMQTDPLNSVQASLISDLSDAGQRMNRLNKSLLLLTKIENNIFPEKEKISVPETFNRLVEQFTYMTEQKNIAIHQPGGPGLTIEANKSLFEILLSNLITNAIRYTPENGKVIITTTANDELVIKNTAVDGALDSSRIFQRFQKSTSHNNSTGLGLAISEKICALNQYSLQYGYSEGMHEFSVRF